MTKFASGRKLQNLCSSSNFKALKQTSLYSGRLCHVCNKQVKRNLILSTCVPEETDKLHKFNSASQQCNSRLPRFLQSIQLGTSEGFSRSHLNSNNTMQAQLFFSFSFNGRVWRTIQNISQEAEEIVEKRFSRWSKNIFKAIWHWLRETQEIPGRLIIYKRYCFVFPTYCPGTAWKGSRLFHALNRTEAGTDNEQIKEFPCLLFR